MLVAGLKLNGGCSKGFAPLVDVQPYLSLALWMYTPSKPFPFQYFVQFPYLTHLLIGSLTTN